MDQYGAAVGSERPVGWRNSRVVKMNGKTGRLGEGGFRTNENKFRFSTVNFVLSA